MIQLDYVLTLKSPLKVSTGIGQAGYLDNTVARDRVQQAVIPGSSIKGKARAMVSRLSEALSLPLHDEDETAGCLITTQPCMVCRLFGSAQWPGKLHFPDATLPADLQKVLTYMDEQAEQEGRPAQNAQDFGRQIRHGIALDRRRRTVLRDRLFTYETVAPPVSFVGRIEGEISNMSTMGDEAVLLAAALEAITHLGSGRGRGMGRCQIEVTDILVVGKAITARNEALARLAKGA